MTLYWGSLTTDEHILHLCVGVVLIFQSLSFTTTCKFINIVYRKITMFRQIAKCVLLSSLNFILILENEYETKVSQYV